MGDINTFLNVVPLATTPNPDSYNLPGPWGHAMHPRNRKTLFWCCRFVRTKFYWKINTPQTHISSLHSTPTHDSGQTIIMINMCGEKTISDLTWIFHGEVNFITKFWIVFGAAVARSHITRARGAWVASIKPRHFRNNNNKQRSGSSSSWEMERDMCVWIMRDIKQWARARVCFALSCKIRSSDWRCTGGAESWVQICHLLAGEKSSSYVIRSYFNQRLINI